MARNGVTAGRGVRLPELAAQLRLPASWQARVRETVARFAVHRYAFPWEGLEELLARQGQAWLVGYGSLMHPASAARTIQATPAEGHTPVLAFGARRVYEYVMPQGVFDRYVAQEPALAAKPRARAALNVWPTGSAEEVFNGRRIPLAAGDLEALRVRERAYDLHPVAMVDWVEEGGEARLEQEWLEQELQLGFALSCPEGAYEGEVFVDRSLQPCPPYHRMCWEGARMVSPAFAELFLQTTYLGDGVTLAARPDVARPDVARPDVAGPDEGEAARP